MAIDRKSEHDASRAQRRSVRGNLLDGLLTLGLFLLFAPWVVRTITEQTGYLKGVTVTHLNLFAAMALLAHILIAALLGAFRLSSLRPGLKGWYVFLWVWGIWMVLWGLLQGHPELFIVSETCTMIAFLAGVAIGVSNANWQRIDKMYALGVGVVGIPVVVLGLATADGLDPDSLKRAFVYTASTILVPATFHILVPDRLNSKFTNALAVFAFAVYGISQVLFAKRAPLLRVIFVSILAFWVIPGWRKRKRFATRVGGAMLLSIGIVIVVVVAGGEGSKAVVERFEKLSGLATAVTGTDRDLTVQSEELDNETFRFKELVYFFDGMSSLETVFGTGLGSYSQHPSLTDRWSVSLGDETRLVYGKTVPHIGMFWGFFKGGGIYFVVLYAGLFSVLSRRRESLRCPLRTNAWAFVLVYVAFSVFEGFWMSPGVEATTFLMGSCVGALAKRETK